MRHAFIWENSINYSIQFRDRKRNRSQAGTRGATVFLSGIEKDLLPQTADDIAKSTGAKVHYLISDFSNPDSIEELGRKAVESMLCRHSGL